MELNLKGKRVLVTGASKGIGRACVELLAQEGCTVLGASRSIAADTNAKAVDIAQGGASHADGIRVIGINPGPVATDRLISLHKQQAAAKFGDESRYEELFAGMSFGRPATSREIANAVAFFASECSAYTSGTILTIDGGQSNRS